VTPQPGEAAVKPDKPDKPDASDKRDVALIHGRTADGEGLRILRQREERLELGEVRPLKEGRPIQGEVVSLKPRPNFPLLCDPSREVLEAYGAYGEKQLYGKTVTGVIRSTFVIDEDGTVEQAQYNVKATGHVAKLRKDLGLD
jgi:hypothetical protein